jgi:cell division protein FtsA
VKSTYLSIGGISLESTTATENILITRADNEVTPMDLENAVDACQERAHLVNKKVVERVPLQFKLDGKEVFGSPIGMKGTKLEVKTLFVTCLDQHFQELVTAVEDAGIDVDDVIPAPIAASLVALSKRQRTVGCLLANIGAETVSIAVFEDDTPVSLQVFPIGSTDITNDIALGFQIPLEEAESVKVKGPTTAYPKKRLSEIIEARLHDIFELIEAHLKKIGRNGLLPAGVVLTGGGAGISTIEDFAKESLKLPSKIATPTLSSAQETFQDSSWFVAYGLCIFGFNQTRESKTAKQFSSVGRGLLDWFKQFLP